MARNKFPDIAVSSWGDSGLVVGENKRGGGGWQSADKIVVREEVVSSCVA